MSDRRDEPVAGIEVLLRSIENLEDRLARVENSALFRFNRAVGGFLGTHKKKLGQWLLRSGLHSLFLRVSPASDESYSRWVKREQEALPSREWHRIQSQQWTFQPRISIVMPVHKPKREWLEAAIASVREQSYEHWQLCICDDASHEPWLIGYLAGLAAADQRIRFVASTQSLGIAGATNRAGTLSDGEFVAFLDHDDVLPWYSLHYIAQACQQPGVAVIYSDEDCLDAQGERERPRFKPGWSPDLLTTCMYLGHLFVVRRALLDEAGWLRDGFDGAQDHDLALRLADREAKVHHVPRILYHWRRHQGSTAGNPQAKQYAHDAARKALEDTLTRRHIEGSVEDGGLPGVFHIRRQVNADPLTSVITCSRNLALVEHMLTKLDDVTEYRNFEVVLVEHRLGGPVFDLTRLRARFGSRLVHVPFGGAFNFAAMNNLGARSAKGFALQFVNDDVEPRQGDWMSRLLAHLQRPAVGAVGAKLLYPSGAVQHAGIALGMMDGAGHPGRGSFRSDLFPWMDCTRNVSAVTGACLGVRRSVFEEVGGFDERFTVNYNDVDLCLRLRERGYEIIYDAAVRLVHKESASRIGGTRLRERVNFYSRWFQKLQAPDPYFPEALDPNHEDVRLLEPL